MMLIEKISVDIIFIGLDSEAINKEFSEFLSLILIKLN